MRIRGIGYEGKSIDQFISELHDAGIELLVDVRANPRSRKPGFGSRQLSARCVQIGIEYLGMPSLGIPSALRRGVRTDEDLARLFLDYRLKLDGMRSILGGLARKIGKRSCAIMCFERDEAKCHRKVLLETLQWD